MYCTRDVSVNCALTQYIVWVIQVLMALYSPSTWCIIIAFLDQLQAERKYLVLMNSGLLCASVSAVQQICIHPWSILACSGQDFPLSHLPLLPAYLPSERQNNLSLFSSSCCQSLQPWHFTTSTGHTLAHYISVCHVFCYEQIGQVVKSIHGSLSEDCILSTTWGILFYPFYAYVSCILYTIRLSLLLPVCWGTLESNVGKNEMTAVDKPKAHSAPAFQVWGLTQTPSVLSDQRPGHLLRDYHCQLCQKRMSWGSS